MKITRTFSVVAIAAVVACPVLAENAKDRLKEATNVVTEILSTPDKGIPSELLEKAECAVIIPGAKSGGFFIGAQYGRGFAICRNASDRGWGAPAAVRMEGGSFGLQIGAKETDVFMLVMNKNGMKRLLDTKFTLDANAGVAAGPVGRSSTAGTDASMGAEILTWSRSRGAFAGISLGGATLRNDLDENEELYGRKVTNREVLSGEVKSPEGGNALAAALNSSASGSRARTK